jgi:serine/threonine protein kinase
VAEPLTSDDPRQLGSYQVRARLGTGGMGQVYLAITPAGRRVALKMVRAEFGDDEQFRARFRQEVAAAQRVHGLFTAQVLDADPDAPQPWLATSYVPGLSLRQAVTEFGPLPEDTVVLLMAGIAEALQAIHAAGIVHRDLKPANVILAADGPRVIDFGIAQAAAAPALTGSGSRVGSPRFMAPEQARGQPATAAVDVFALGSLATYASTGHPPFGTDHPLAVLGRVLHDPPSLDGCPPDLRDLIERCLAKDPAQRPPPGDIIDTCRAMAGGGLSFERPWLPVPVYAATATAATPEVTRPGPDPGPPESPGTEWTFASETGRGPGEPAGPEPGTDSGPVRDPGELTSPAGSMAGGLTALPLAEGAIRLAGEGAKAAPGTPAGSAGPTASGQMTGSAPGKSPGRRRRAAVAAAGTAAALIAGAVVLSAASTGGGRPPQPQGGPGPAAAIPAGPANSGSPLRTSAPGGQSSSQAGTHHAGSSTAPASGGGAAPSAPGAPPSPDPVADPTPSTALSGQAAFAGTWDGTVSQAGGDVTSWTVRLVIPASGTGGSYSASSLGCAGTLKVTGKPASTMAAQIKTTSPLYLGCAKVAHLTLSPAGSGELSMTWEPTGKNKSVGTAVLSGS